MLYEMWQMRRGAHFSAKSCQVQRAAIFNWTLTIRSLQILSNKVKKN